MLNKKSLGRNLFNFEEQLSLCLSAHKCCNTSRGSSLQNKGNVLCFLIIFQNLQQYNFFHYVKIITVGSFHAQHTQHSYFKKITKFGRPVDIWKENMQTGHHITQIRLRTLVLNLPEAFDQWVSGGEGSRLYKMCKLKLLATTFLTKSKGFIISGAFARVDQESNWDPE